MKLANKKHDVVALQIYDKRETELPNAGLLRLQDSETGEIKLIDSGNKNTRDQYRKNWLKHERKILDTFMRCGVDKVKIHTDESYISPLMLLFKRRGSKK